MIGMEQEPARKAAGAGASSDSILSALQRSELWRNFRRAFEAGADLPLELKRPDSFQFPLDGSTRQNRFCALMAMRSRSCAACLELQQRLHDDAAQGPKTMQCAAGLSESAVPVRVGAAVIGYLRTGQVFLDPPRRNRLAEIVRRLEGERKSADVEQLEAAYFQTRALSRTQYLAALSILRIFAEHLGALANRLVIERSHVELPVIAKARAFMAQNLSEHVRLEDVAHAASLSPFYFCKLFGRATGMTFTKYLARLRVEVVKQKLLNPHTRVCEAAFAAGFRSLSQFNRVFHRVAGETPGVFRRRMRVAPAAAVKP